MSKRGVERISSSWLLFGLCLGLTALAARPFTGVTQALDKSARAKPHAKKRAHHHAHRRKAMPSTRHSPAPSKLALELHAPQAVERDLTPLDIEPARPIAAPEPEPFPPVADSPPAQTETPPSAPSLSAVRTQTAPTIDGVLDDVAWRAPPPSAAFTQKTPGDGKPPTEQTSVRVLYDDDAVYVAFECTQTASPIAASLARRDRPTETDWVSIAFDGRADGRSAFEFSVSAAGTLIDGVRFDDGKIAREWDAIWEARTQIREGGWSAEFRIPLQALRFDGKPETTWLMQARRYISARQEIDEWAYIPRAAGGEVSHYGQLDGLHDLSAQHVLELQPFVLGRARHQSPDPQLASTGWDVSGSAGLDFKWHASPTIALDGTIHPDFGQVEADRLILNLSTVELVFPEKRPFFLSGMDDFTTLAPIFYSRRIGRTPRTPPLSTDPLQRERLFNLPSPAPVYGALKLVGDLNDSWTVAALSALTGPNTVDVALPDGARRPRLLDPLTSYNVLRVRTELAPGLDLGATATATFRNEPGFGWPSWLTSNAAYLEAPTPLSTRAVQHCPLGELTSYEQRCFHDAYVGSLDVSWRSESGAYAVRGQAYASAIEGGPERVLPDGTLVRPGDLGSGGILRLSKQGGGHWLLDGTVAAHSRKLDFNDLGFMDRQNYVRAGAYLEYRTLEPWNAIMETHTSALAYGENNLNGLALGRGVLLMENLVLDNRWTLTLGGHATTARFDDREVGDGTALERAAILGAVEAVSTDPRRSLVLSAQALQERLHAGLNLGAQLDLTWRPASMLELQIQPSYTYNFGEPRYAGAGQAADELVFGRLRAESAGVTVRASYAFLPTLTLQAYAQAFFAIGRYFDYAHVTRAAGAPAIVHLSDLVAGPGPVVRPDFEHASLAVNVVLRWEYHLGSALYLLYVRSQNPDVTLDAARAPRIDLNALRAAAASDVLMLKLAYWLG